MQQLLRVGKQLPPGELHAATMRAAQYCGLPLTPPTRPPSSHAWAASEHTVSHAHAAHAARAAHAAHVQQQQAPPALRRHSRAGDPAHAAHATHAAGDKWPREESWGQEGDQQDGWDQTEAPMPDLMAGLDMCDWQLAPAEPPPNLF